MWSQMQHDGWETVNVHVREKKKWKKYPCAVRGVQLRTVQRQQSTCMETSRIKDETQEL